MMKAIVYRTYGPPDVLKLEQIPKPTPKDNEVLVQVHAASANPGDWHILRADPFFARFTTGLFRPKHKVLGFDVVGRVEATGRNARQFQSGDAVYGDLSENRWGAFAEYACARENAFALKPANLTFEQAAAVPLAGVTALQGLRDTGKIQAGQRVLINGASGGVGTFAVQIAKSFGAEVTGVCSTRNVGMVRSIGAEHVIDYTQEDFTKNGQQYDLIFDAVANHSVSEYKRALRPQGTCVVAGFSTISHMLQVALLGSWVSKRGGKKIGLMGTARPNARDLVFIGELLESGRITPIIDRRYPLAEVPDAIRYVETGHARGKVVITVEPSQT